LCFLKKEQREREGRREGPKVLVPPFIRVLETDSSKIALMIYKSTVIPIRSLLFLSTTNKKILEIYIF
jgi:hypothetical protein